MSCDVLKTSKTYYIIRILLKNKIIAINLNIVSTYGFYTIEWKILKTLSNLTLFWLITIHQTNYTTTHFFSLNRAILNTISPE